MSDQADPRCQGDHGLDVVGVPTHAGDSSESEPHACPHGPEQPNRRAFLKAAVVTAGVFGAMPAAQRADLGGVAAAAGTRGDEIAASRDRSDSTRLVLLGTAGTPPPVAERSGIASALIVEDSVYLVDAGRGTMSQFVAAGLSFNKLKAVFVTHMHADHVVDLFSIFALNQTNARPPAPVQVWGPPRAPDGVFPFPVPSPVGVARAAGTTDLINRSIEALSYSVNFFSVGGSHISTLVEPHDVPVAPEIMTTFKGSDAPAMDPFVVFEDDNVRVSAVLVPHMFPSFAYRFDTAAGSFVLSGDTSKSANVVRLAQGADVLVHEVADVDAYIASLDQLPGPEEQLRTAFLASHTNSTQIGAVAEEAGARALVLNHFVPATADDVSKRTWRRRSQAGYTGRVVVGEDLMVLDAAARRA